MAFNPTLVTGAPPILRARARLVAAMGANFGATRETGGTLPSVVWIDGVSHRVVLISGLTEGGATSQHTAIQSAIDAHYSGPDGPVIFVIEPGGPYMLGNAKVQLTDRDDIYISAYGARFEAIERRNIGAASYAGFDFDGCHRHGVVGLTARVTEGDTNETWNDGGTTRAISRAYVWREHSANLVKLDASVRGINRSAAIPKDRAASILNWIMSGLSGSRIPTDFICCDNATTGGRGALRVSGCDGFVVSGNRWAHTLSDCQHTDRACQNGWIGNNAFLWSGDDGLPLVGYKVADHPNPVRNVIVERNLVTGTRSRGLLVHGVQNVIYRDNLVQQATYCGIGITGEDYVGEEGYGNTNIGFIRNELFQVAMSRNTSLTNWLTYPVGVVTSPRPAINVLIQDTVLHVVDEHFAIQSVTDATKYKNIGWGSSPDGNGNAIVGTRIIDQRARLMA